MITITRLTGYSNWNVKEQDLVKTALSLTHWGRVTHKCIKIYVTIALDNGLSPNRRQAII